MADEQLNLGFGGRRSPLMRRLAAMIAPVAADAGAVVEDEELLGVARAVCDAFGNESALGGLTKAEIVERVDGTYAEHVLDSRLGVFVRMELLRPIRDKKHQQRYVLAPSGLVGLLMFERVSERGGVEELLNLLDRTRVALERHEADRPAVTAALDSLHSLFGVFANEVARLVSDASLEELLEERRFHDQSGLMERVAELNRLVTDEFHELDAAAYRLVVEAQRYISAVEDLLLRVLDEGGETHDFSLLDPEEYLSAARTATIPALAEVAGTVVFDPASPFVDAGSIVDAIETYRPHRTVRARPPEPPGESGEADPLERVADQHAQAQRRRALRAEQLLQDDQLVDVTAPLRASGWPGAALMLSDLIALDGEPAQPYRVRMSDEAIVDRDGPVTYVARVELETERGVTSSPTQAPGQEEARV